MLPTPTAAELMHHDARVKRQSRLRGALVAALVHDRAQLPGRRTPRHAAATARIAAGSGFRTPDT